MKIKRNAAYVPFWLMALFFVVLLYVPWLLAPGMHPDGVAYATLGRNLAEGRGTFWAPYFSQTTYHAFYEHPPLVFGIESLFYRLFGDHLFVDKLYTFICFVISAWLFVKIWTHITGDKANAWLPIIFWVCISEVSFVYANNFLENTMGIFCFASCVLLLKYFETGNRKVFMLIVSGLLVVLGFLAEGPLSLFVWTLPAMYWLVIRKINLKVAIVCTLCLVIVFTVCFVVLMAWPVARHNILSYWSSQVVMSIEGKRSLPGGRFFVLNTLIYKLKPIYIAVPIALLAGALLTRGKNIRPQFRSALFFLVMALSINLPVMVSPKQFEQYILCAYAFYAMAGAALLFPYFDFWIKKLINDSWAIHILNVSILIAIAIVFYRDVNYQKPYIIDAETSMDLHNMKPYFSKINKVSNCNSLDGDWALKANLYRKFHVSMAGESTGNEYFLSAPDCTQNVPLGYKRVFTGSKYILFCKTFRHP